MKFKILKDRNFSLLMFGKISSLIGSSMQSFALSLFVLASTGSATKFASILAVSIIPQLILGPFAGVFVDWFNRKKIMIVLDLLSGFIVSIFAFMYFIKGSISLEYIYLLVILLSLISTLFQPTIQTVIPTITKDDALIEANSINSLMTAIGNLISPALAGVLYGLLGLQVIFIFNAISFFISAFSECFLVIPNTTTMKDKPSLKLFFTDFSEGIKFTLSKKTILSVVTLAMILNFALGSLTIGITYMCKSILKVSDLQYGLSESFGVFAMIIATFFIGYLAKKYSIGKNLYLSLFLTGIITCFYGIVTFQPFINSFETNFPPYLLLLLITFVVFLLIGVANIFVGIYFQTIVPLEYMGRVGTVLSTVSMAAVPFSNMIFGVLFDKISPTLIFPISGIIVIIPVLLYKKVLLSVQQDEVKESVAELT